MLEMTDQSGSVDDSESWSSFLSVQDSAPNVDMGLAEKRLTCHMVSLRGRSHSRVFRCVTVLFFLAFNVPLWTRVFERLLLPTGGLLGCGVPVWCMWLLFTVEEVEIVCLIVLIASLSVCSVVWNWAVLPRGEQGEALKVEAALRRFSCLSFAMLAAWAVLGYRLAVPFALVYLILGIGTLVRDFFARPGVQRMCRAHGLLLPMLLRYELLDRWARRIDLPEAQHQRELETLHVIYAPQLYARAVELGGAWIKLGQKVTCFPILPSTMHNQLKKLQNSVPPRDARVIRDIIEGELMQSLEDTFQSFEDKPLGAASIGQVHRAVLKDGVDVVVKVQYPELRTTMHSDMRAFVFFASLRGVRKPAEEMSASLLAELNFVDEARTLERIRANLKDSFPDVVTPLPIMSLSTPLVLVMTVVPGVSLMDAALRMIQTLAKMCGMGELTLDDLMMRMRDGEVGGSDAASEKAPPQEWHMLKSMLAALDTALSEETKAKLTEKAMTTARVATNFGVALYNRSAVRFGATPIESVPNFDMSALSLQLWTVFGHQVFVDGFFSTDPHPGNILVDEETGRLGFIDFGGAIEISTEVRVRFARAMMAVADGSDEEIAQSYAQLGWVTAQMSVELLSTTAKLHLGNLPFSSEILARMKRLMQEEGGEPRYDGFDSSVRLLTQSVMMLRGSSMCLGTIKSHYPAAVWKQYAAETLRLFGDVYPVRKVKLKSPRASLRGLPSSFSLPTLPDPGAEL